jgi:hypothetical protein
MNFQSKNLNFEMVLYFIDVHQYHSPQKKFGKNFTNNFSFEIYIEILKAL